MESIDKLAVCNKLLAVHPAEKTLFSLSSLLMVLFSNSIILSLVVFALMVWMVVQKGGIPLLSMMKLMIIPFAFILTGLIPVLISFNSTPFDGGVPLGQGIFYWGITREGFMKSFLILVRSLSGISCFYFLILTTPVSQIDYLFNVMKISPLFREMVILIYRYIFLLLRMAEDIYRSQRMRHGFTSFFSSIRSLGMLSVSVLVKSGSHSDQAFLALQSRGCEQNILFIQPDFKRKGENFVLIVLNLCFLIFLKIVGDKWHS